MSKRNVKKFLSTLVCVGLLLAMPGTLFAQSGINAPFKDVSGALSDEIGRSYSLQLVEGYPDGSFQPNKAISRSEFAALVAHVAQRTGITPPAPSGDNTPIKREEAAAMLGAALQTGSAGEDFADVPDDSPYAGAIGKISEAGIMGGYGSGRFGFGDTMTRGQAAAVALRLYDYVKPFELLEAGIPDLQEAMTSGKITSEQLVRQYLDRIAKYDHQGPSINSLITVNPKALEIAAQLDQERKEKGPRGPLHGIPIIVKDNFDTADMVTSAGCLCLKTSVPPEDAFQIKKLKDAGAIILAKANLHEFAFGITTQSSLGGQTLNPYALDRTPGGSSGGTGASIASNFAAAGMGTDTGGSIRIPSSFNSLVGIRPTIGLSSRSGIIPLALTQDVGGPIAKTVTDAAILLDATAGYDPDDVVTAGSVGHIPVSYTQYLQEDGLKGARIGFVTQLLEDKPEAASVNQVTYQALDEMRKLGAEVLPVTLPDYDKIVKYPSLSSWEFKFQLNEYLAKLGPNAPMHSLGEIIDSGQFDQSQKQSMIDRNVRTSLDTAEYKDIVLFRTRTTQQSLLKLMADQRLDALVYPSTSQPAALIGKGQTSGNNNRLSAFTGFPAITVPAGFTPEGLPVGIEFLARAYDEPTLIKLGYSYEQGTHHRKAPVSTP
ncbi:amidase family protein [Paenibacillus filicis]|uniref:Amidase family protein n=1 Tax=Paenibacillus gyeongsangnamensis TaxID=3388067 RepID=A0ABT4Q4H3_9BACL|nr:amidase family protein [Paenibacillus filicis]MCZ8511778.1 amidase family protein [Paenibacillus filicis]